MSTNIEKLINLVDRLLLEVGNIELYWERRDAGGGYGCTRSEEELDVYNEIIEELSNVRNDMTEI